MRINKIIQRELVDAVPLPRKTSRPARKQSPEDVCWPQNKRPRSTMWQSTCWPVNDKMPPGAQSLLPR